MQSILHHLEAGSSVLSRQTSWAHLFLSTSVAVAIYTLVLRPFYNVFLHPLRKYPGPKLWAASSLPWGFAFKGGNWHHKIMELHQKYGHVIRIGPNELSYDVPEAWEDVYGRSKNRKENPKPTWYLSPKRKEIVGSLEKDHTRMRRLLGNGFTNASMLEQEPLIAQNVDSLIQRLREKAVLEQGKTKVDIFEWFSFCTFDIIGDLVFGEPFGCLREGVIHPWLAWAFDDVKLSHMLVLSIRIPFFAIFLPILDTIRLWRNAVHFEEVVREYIRKRLAREPERPDFLQLMGTKKGGAYMTEPELYRNAGFLTLAGSETTSTTSAVAYYYIGIYPEIKAKILKELHATFKSEEEINLRSAAKLSYLMAVIEESMRCHPPGPNALWRRTPAGGNRILGDWIPGNVRYIKHQIPKISGKDVLELTTTTQTVLGIPHRVMYRSEHNFRRAQEFIPERWLAAENDKSEFAGDRRDGFHPFSYGPRTCLAVNLAYAEMRYILARMMWNFDFEIDKQSRHWADTLHSWLVWETRPLHVVLHPRKLGQV